jgi:hypothetical protein
MQPTHLKPENAKAIVILIAGIAVVVILVVFISKTFGGFSKFFGSISDSLGITDSPETAALKESVSSARAQSASVSSPWSPQLYKNAPSGAHLTTQAFADKLAAQIWNSTGIFTADIEDVLAAVKQLSYQSQVSFLADRFSALYNKDLLSWITLQYTKMGIPDPGLQTVINYVNGLTKY